MPFREPALSLRDILDGVDMIVQFVRGMGTPAGHAGTRARRGTPGQTERSRRRASAPLGHVPHAFEAFEIGVLRPQDRLIQAGGRQHDAVGQGQFQVVA